MKKAKKSPLRTQNRTAVSTDTNRISLPAPWMNTPYDNLCKALLSLKTKKEMQAFMRDLCTEQEIEELTNRFTIAGMLFEKLPYATIEQKTGASTATIARIKQWLRGGMGGYRVALSRMHHSINKSNPVAGSAV